MAQKKLEFRVQKMWWVVQILIWKWKCKARSSHACSEVMKSRVCDGHVQCQRYHKDNRVTQVQVEGNVSVLSSSQACCCLWPSSSCGGSWEGSSSGSRAVESGAVKITKQILDMPKESCRKAFVLRHWPCLKILQLLLHHSRPKRFILFFSWNWTDWVKKHIQRKNCNAVP